MCRIAVLIISSMFKTKHFSVTRVRVRVRIGLGSVLGLRLGLG